MIFSVLLVGSTSACVCVSTRARGLWDPLWDMGQRCTQKSDPPAPHEGAPLHSTINAQDYPALV